MLRLRLNSDNSPDLSHCVEALESLEAAPLAGVPVKEILWPCCQGAPAKEVEHLPITFSMKAHQPGDWNLLHGGHAAVGGPEDKGSPSNRDAVAMLLWWVQHHLTGRQWDEDMRKLGGFEYFRKYMFKMARSEIWENATAKQQQEAYSGLQHPPQIGAYVLHVNTPGNSDRDAINSFLLYGDDEATCKRSALRLIAAAFGDNACNVNKVIEAEEGQPWCHPEQNARSKMVELNEGLNVYTTILFCVWGLCCVRSNQGVFSNWRMRAKHEFPDELPGDKFRWLLTTLVVALELARVPSPAAEILNDAAVCVSLADARVLPHTSAMCGFLYGEQKVTVDNARATRNSPKNKLRAPTVERPNGASLASQIATMNTSAVEDCLRSDANIQATQYGAYIAHSLLE